jgi:probable F420-dependent oxidoreductase
VEIIRYTVAFLSPAWTRHNRTIDLVDEFGRYGVWASRRLWPEDPGELAEAAVELESLGYGSVWIGGTPTDDLALPEAILAATTRLVVGTSIVNIWRSDAAVLNASHERVRTQFPGRFYLGLGSGHAPAVEATGQKYVRPVSKLRSFAESLPDVPPEERLFAALGPRALEAARDLSAGALPYLVPPAHTADARRILGSDRLLIPEQKVFLGTDEAVARAVSRKAAGQYLSLPNYVNNLRRYGLTDDDFTGHGSDRWVDTVVLWGDEDAIRTGVNAHLAAGADRVAVQALSASSHGGLPRAEWRAIAKALIG